MRPIHPRAALAALALALAPAALPAQTIRGTVTDARSGHRVAGAVVVLLDGVGVRHDAALTDAEGRYAVRASRPGTYRVRAERVGYAAASSPVRELALDQQATEALIIAPSLVTLDAVVARGVPRQCTIRPENGAQAAVVWDEARKALEAAELGARRRAYRYRLRLFRRNISFPTLSVSDSTSSLEHGVSGQPFRSTPLDRLVSHGYVQNEGDSIVFHAPDAPTLLSDTFLDHHCFSLRLGTGPNAGLVGLAFAPVRGRRRPDVQGTLWLERRTGHLRFVEYTYTGLPYSRTRDDLGGRIEFGQVADGGWIVSRWTIRMPVLELQHGEVVPIVAALIESGGEVLDIRPASRVEVSPNPAA